MLAEVHSFFFIIYPVKIYLSNLYTLFYSFFTLPILPTYIVIIILLNKPFLYIIQFILMRLINLKNKKENKIANPHLKR